MTPEQTEELVKAAAGAVGAGVAALVMRRVLRKADAPEWAQKSIPLLTWFLTSDLEQIKNRVSV